MNPSQSGGPPSHLIIAQPFFPEILLVHSLLSCLEHWSLLFWEAFPAGYIHCRGGECAPFEVGKEGWSGVGGLLAANWGNWPPGHEEEERRLLQLIFSDTAMPLWTVAERHTLVERQRGREAARARQPRGRVPLPAFRGEV